MDMHNISEEILQQRINTVTLNNGYDARIGHAIFNLIKYMQEKQLQGGCHALSSVLYVALSELGMHPMLCIGECQKEKMKPFDHSWILVDGKIIDIAIFMPLSGPTFSGPVVFDTDIVTMEKASTCYGICTGLPLDEETLFIMSMPFSDYMSAFPNEINGLWTVVNKILSPDGKVATRKLVRKYSTVERHYLDGK